MWECTNPLFPSLLLQLMLLCHSIRTENREERDTLRKRRAKGKKEVEWEDETETGEPSQTHIVFTKNRKEGREEEP